MFTYKEYHKVASLEMSGLHAGLFWAESHEVGFNSNVPGMVLKSIEQLPEFSGRSVDFIKSEGFLGFMLLLPVYSKEFSEDADFWIEVWRVKMNVMDIIASNSTQGEHDVIVHSPGYAACELFLRNPKSFIKTL